MTVVARALVVPDVPSPLAGDACPTLTAGRVAATGPLCPGGIVLLAGARSRVTTAGGVDAAARVAGACLLAVAVCVVLRPAPAFLPPPRRAGSAWRCFPAGRSPRGGAGGLAGPALRGTAGEMVARVIVGAMGIGRLGVRRNGMAGPGGNGTHERGRGADSSDTKMPSWLRRVRR
ncbi:MAG: hypothetical protein LBK72_09900 [Bifidobacteriaceae bacterium]|nr:hypothetical protein [Bifidobacteriaceae bacterium]